jgi:enoyl-CoA hydratase
MEVLLESGGERVALVRINRPEARNALNGAVREQLARTFVELAGNDEIRCVVLTGTEKVFVAGADITAMADAQHVDMIIAVRRGGAFMPMSTDVHRSHRKQQFRKWA